jgi:hypothetical protein
MVIYAIFNGFCLYLNRLSACERAKSEQIKERPRGEFLPFDNFHSHEKKINFKHYSPQKCHFSSSDTRQKIANSKNKKSESRNMQAVAKKSFSYQNRHISPCEGRLSETSLVSASLSVADILREFSASLPEFFLEFLVGQKNYLQGRSSDIFKKN